MRRVEPSRQYSRCEPFFLQWHITDQCNLSCLHCYRDTPAKDDLPRAKLLAVVEDFQSFLRAINRKGRIHISGGEPFLSPHLFILLQAARDRGIPARVFSNGTLITEEAATKLIECGCSLVQVSIEGGRETHDRIRGEGSFDKAVEGMRILRASGVEVTVSMTVSKLNVGDVENVAEIARTHADRFHVARFVPVNTTRSMGADCTLTSAELRSCFRRVFEFKQTWPDLDVPLRDPLWREFLRVSPRRHKACVHGCAAGFNGLALDCDGAVYPCRRLPVALGNILEESLLDIWRRSPVLAQLRDRDALKGQCGTCGRRWLCGGCRAAALAIQGGILEEDPQCFKRRFSMNVWGTRRPAVLPHAP